MVVDQLDVGDGVLYQILRFEGVVVVLNIVGVVLLHAFQEAFAPRLQQLLRLC